MSYHSVEVMVYQYDKLFGCPNPNPHFYILVGYFWGTVILNWLPWQPAGKFRVPQKYKTVGYGWDTSHPTTISKKFIILIYHYLHAVILKALVSLLFPTSGIEINLGDLGMQVDPPDAVEHLLATSLSSVRIQLAWIVIPHSRSAQRL